MPVLIRSTLARRGAAVAATSLIAAGAVAATAAPASAAPHAGLKVSYKLTGTTHLAGPNANLSLGPGTLSATISPGGKVSATLSLPPSTGSFKEGGLIPVTATAQLINDGPTTGTVSGSGTVSTTSNVTLQLLSLSVAGLPVPVGNACETATPVVVSLKSQKGFSALDGGKLAGTYTIPPFHHCGLATLLINLTIPASGNTISLKLGKAKIG
jgi:hypothetical protein